MSQPDLSILIVTWNAWPDLSRCLASLQRIQGLSLEILVVDNGSNDNTVDLVNEKYSGQVKLLENATNLGLPAAVNQGLQAVGGRYVMLLDVDTEVAEGAAERLYEFMQATPTATLSAPLIRNPRGMPEGTARNLPSIMSGLFGRRSIFTRWFPNNPFTRRYMGPDRDNATQPFKVEQVSAACMFFRRELIELAGLWDEAYRCYWVDTDWCARLKKLGQEVWCVPLATITHYENNRVGVRKQPWRIWHFHTGAFRVYRKYYAYGWLDPRSIIAGSLLMTRAGVQFVLNEFQPSAEDKAAHIAE